MPALSLGTLGRYQLLRRLAVGGMGELFLARARSIGGFEKLAVIKRILPHLAEQAEFVQMFLDEARLAATLEHPNIVHVSDLGHVGNDYFLVMPFLEGADLSTLRKRLAAAHRTMPLALAVFIASGVASGLDHAHTKRDRNGRPMGLIHRDVSPENIFVTYEGEVKVLDFGIAKAAQTVSRTDVGVRRGKARYMSPEQANGLALDARTDVFSLGVVLYELTTGHPLFQADDDLALLRMMVSRDATPPSQLVPSYPAELQEIVLRALQRDPAKRYQSAADLRGALDRFARSDRGHASAVELGEFLIEALGARGSHSGEEGSADLPPPPLSGALMVGPARAAAARSSTPVTSETTPTLTLSTRASAFPGAAKVAAVALLVGATIAVGVAAWRRHASSDPPETDAQALPQQESPPVAVVTHEPMPQARQVVDLVNERRPSHALEYAERHDAIRYLQAAGLGAQIDEPLQLALDLLQAGATERPCETFDAALTMIERVPIPYFVPALEEARVPSANTAADRSCADLEPRRVAALSAARGESPR